METANEINYNSFGDINNQADSLLIELTNSVISFCEFDVKLNCPLRINHYPIDSSIPNNNIDHIINSSKHFQTANKNTVTFLLIILLLISHYALHCFLMLKKVGKC
jgi:hypothetical protein